MTTYLNIGITGLRAAQIGLATTQHNIANVNTVGFSRQETYQATGFAMNTDEGALGQGVKIETVKRNYNQFLVSQAQQSQSKLSELQTQYANLSQIDNLLADPTAGLAPTLRDFFSGVQQVASDPSLVSARQAMVASAQTLSSRFQVIDDRLQALSGQSNQQIEAAVSKINALSNNIADLNQRIVIAQSAYEQPPNDLLDQRDYLLNEMNKLIRVDSSKQYDGTIDVYLGTGHRLVGGDKASELFAVPKSSDAGKLVVALGVGDDTLEMPDDLMKGGELGAILGFRNGMLDQATKVLGQVAASVALTVNAQQALGQNLYGQKTGEGDFVDRLFDISPPDVRGNSNNSGTGRLTATYLSPNFDQGKLTTELTGDSYEVRVTATGVDIFRQSNGQQVTPVVVGASYQFEGLEFQISGAADVGDSFMINSVGEAAASIRVNTAVAGDPRLLAAAAPLRTAQGNANQGTMQITLAHVAPGYVPNDVNFTVNAAGELTSGFAGNWSATYGDGSVVTSTGNIPGVSGTSPLRSISIEGASFSVSGIAVENDTFSIQRNSGGVQDARNFLRMADLQTQKTMSGGLETFNTRYSAMVADAGIQTREVKVRMEAQETFHTQLEAARDSASGVNLDEEAANLLKYQQAYQASAKALQIGVDLFERLLAIR
ncbi:MAG: flagellar hook-associated protein FlgK [Azonexus sp.]|jgi:flagellar hook-associated protein 1 FlgK|nr:flagellar hook-associated protein FlgK [Azonexus sp.]